MVSGALLALPSQAQDAASPAPVVREPAEDAVAPAPGAEAMTLARAVALSLEQNFTVLSAADNVSTSRMQETVARAQFFPKLVPSYAHSAQGPSLGLEARQKLPFTGGTFSASAGFRSSLEDGTPFPRTSDARFTLTQPLLRGFGPNAAFFDVRNGRRGRESQERSFALTRQRVAIDVTSAFYQVILQRQLLAVARQSLKRSETLQKASEARLQVGLVSKLDVFRAELLASQAQEAMVQAETSLQTALEAFRAALGLAATSPVEPEAIELPTELAAEPLEPIDVLVARAQHTRLDLMEGRDQVEDAERSASLARQNLLPQLDLNFAMTQLGLGTSFSSAWKAGGSDRRYTVFLSSSYPLERSQEAASRATAAINVAARRRGLHQQELQIETEVRAAVRQIERLAKSIELQKKAVDIADQQRQLANLRYQRGLASNFDVVDAEGSLVVARSALVGLLTSHRLARYELLRATGGLDVEREFLR